VNSLARLDYSNLFFVSLLLDFLDPLFPLFNCFEPILEEEEEKEEEGFRRPISSNHDTLFRLYIGQSGIQSYDTQKETNKQTTRRRQLTTSEIPNPIAQP
jgi:hypothetical protein